jgi:hypothetical protein
LKINLAFLQTIRQTVFTMDKETRFARIRELAGKSLALSPVAAEILEELRKEDSDLGGAAPIGEILPAEDVRKESRPGVEDEEEPDTSLAMSPEMRRTLYGDASADEVPEAAIAD